MSGVHGAFNMVMTVLAGAVMTAFGGVLVAGPQPYSGGEVASATVVAVDQDHTADRARFYPVVEFEVGGTVHRVTVAHSTAFAPSVGATIEVSFPPDRPDLARSLDQPQRTMVVAIAVIVAGTLTIVVAIAAWRLRLKRSMAGPGSTAG